MEQDELGVWTTPGGDRIAWFADPDGNVLSLTQFHSAGTPRQSATIESHSTDRRGLPRQPLAEGRSLGTTGSSTSSTARRLASGRLAPDHGPPPHATLRG